MFCNTSLVKGQDVKVKQLKFFINAVADSNMNTDDVIKKYICPLSKGKDNDKDYKNYQFVSMQVNSLRKELLSKNKGSLIIRNYKDLPDSEQNILHANTSINNIFVVFINNKRFIRVLFTGNKIASFVTMNKGDKGVFIKFCADGD